MPHILDMEEQFFVATKLCLQCGDEILVLTESYPWLPLWRELPWGKISKADGENSPMCTLNREIQEELWITLNMTDENTHLFHVEKRYELTTQGKRRPFIFLCYLSQIWEKPQLRLTEHEWFYWIKASEINTFSDWRPGFNAIVTRAFSTANNL